MVKHFPLARNFRINVQRVLKPLALRLISSQLLKYIWLSLNFQINDKIGNQLFWENLPLVFNGHLSHIFLIVYSLFLFFNGHLSYISNSLFFVPLSFYCITYFLSMNWKINILIREYRKGLILFSLSGFAALLNVKNVRTYILMQNMSIIKL